MADPIRLKGNFDAMLDRAEKIMERFEHRLMLENARPTIWSNKQVEDMLLIRDFMFEIYNSVSEFAARARDD